MENVVQNLSAEKAHKLTPYKTRIFAGISVYKLKPKPEFVREPNDMGLVIQRPEFYDEFEFPQLCVNVNKKEITMDEAKLLLKNLNDAILTQLRSSGILK